MAYCCDRMQPIVWAAGTAFLAAEALATSGTNTHKRFMGLYLQISRSTVVGMLEELGR